MSDWELAGAIAGLALMNIATRGLFILPRKAMPMPAWLRQGLRHAPVAALVAVVLPELVLRNGHLLQTWRDPGLAGAAAALLWLAWRRTDLLGTIVIGTAAMLICRLGLGW